jgi:peptide/nickel transport system permease protein
VSGAWQALRRSPLITRVALIVVMLYLATALFAPVLAPFGETSIVGPPYQPWGEKFVIGTDNLGRDMWSRLIYGARNTIGVAVLITALAFLIGVPLSFLSSIVGGWLDQLLSRAIDTLIAIPSLVLALLFLTILGNSIGIMVVVIAVVEATRVFRVARSVAQNIVVMDFVEAARLRGDGLGWIARHEILPNALPPLLVEFGLRFCYTFLFISSLSFLGLGIQPPTASWGSMVRDNATLITYGDVTPLVPAAAIGLLAVCVNLLVDRALELSSRLKT